MTLTVPSAKTHTARVATTLPIIDVTRLLAFVATTLTDATSGNRRPSWLPSAVANPQLACTTKP